MYSNSFKAGVWVLVCLGLSSWGHGECFNDCGGGGTAEGEPCLVDLGEDVTNGGCNSDPVVFSEISCGETVCGVISTYDVDTNGDEIPDADLRDTDWYLIGPAELAAADLDGNGVVHLQAWLVSEFPGVTFFVTFEPDCDHLGQPGSTGFSDLDCAGGLPAELTLIVADHPGGVVAFVSSGNPDGSGIFDGFECSTGLNDYTLLVECLELPTSCAPGPPRGPCNEPNPGVPGCEDPACCAQVCEQPGLMFCCIVFWSQACADAAIEQGCAEEPGGPVCMATGPSPNLEGYLEVCADAYGAWSTPSFGGLGDRFNPVGGADDQEATFTSGFFLFKPDTVQRELLATSSDWQALFGADASLNREVIVDNVESDTNGDGVTDTLTSTFAVTGAGVDLTFDLDQNVDRIVGGGGSVSAAITQTYTITNNLPTPIDFDLLRLHDGDLVWSADLSDDSVGTENAADANSVFIQEEDTPPTLITVSSPDADGYFGAKTGIDPDGPGPGPAMGAGTDTQEWEAYGIPQGWENYIAGVGYEIDGESGASPAGCVDPCDGHLGLRIPVSIGPGGQVTVTVGHGYGGDVVVGEIGFDDPQDFPADGVPIIHAMGDLDGNATTDVAAAMPDLNPELPGKVQVFRNLGNDLSGQWEGLEANTPITVGREPSGIALGPFDSDPHLDMAVTNARDNNVWILRNNGTGDATFTVTHVIPIGTRPSAITSGFFNPDGFIDLAVTNETDNNVVILFGDGNGNFTVGGAAGGGIPVAQEPVGLLADDFDNNDDDDMAGVSRGQSVAGSTGTVWVLRSNGDGTFQPPDDYDIGTNPTAISAGDVNRDTFVDIVAVNADDNTVSVLINLGNGTFAPAVPFPVGAQPLSIEAVDLDNDVDADLVVVAAVSEPPVRVVQVLENLILGGPDPDFGDPLDIGVGANANFVVAGDLNNDGYADLVTVNTDESGTSGSVTVLLGSGEAGPEPCPWDCQLDPDGAVNVSDFLALLAQWGGPGSCDFDGGGVAVTDFLILLGSWGPCP